MAVEVRDPAGRYVVLWRDRVLVEARTRALVAVEAARVPDGAEIVPFEPGSLGPDDGAAPAGFVVLHGAHDGIGQLPDDSAVALRFVDPMFELGRTTGTLRRGLVRALAVARWSEAMRFCPRCAASLAWDVPGRVKICSNPSPHRHWPRLEPSAIMLVSDGERMLLGRQASWPEGMYSTLAGFVDQGESVEQTVAREVFEESGVVVGNVEYFGSEPWPFPGSLMLGFFAEAETHEIVRGEELEDVRWFTYDEGMALQRRLAERTPHADTIARRLIATWLRERTVHEALS